MVGSRPGAYGLDVIERHTSGLTRLAADANLASPVPTCDGWTLGDLVLHLTEVQNFWAHIIERRPAGPETYEAPTVAVDASPAACLADALRGLLAALDRADPTERAWSWADEQTVGFTVRRQSHEALIHHLDGLLAMQRPLPAVPAELAADGIDELIDVMVCGVPDWATFTPSIEVIAVESTDTGDRWTLGLGTISGTSTQSGFTYTDAPAADRLADTVPPDVAIRGSALELMLWLWGRGDAARLELAGEISLAAALRELVVLNTQ